MRSSVQNADPEGVLHYSDELVRHKGDNTLIDACSKALVDSFLWVPSPLKSCLRLSLESFSSL